jgi:hypothetical protein
VFQSQQPVHVRVEREQRSRGQIERKGRRPQFLGKELNPDILAVIERQGQIVGELDLDGRVIDVETQSRHGI